jgi:intracellular septation protein A
MLEKNTPQAKENGLLNILINIVIPVLILNKLGAKIGALPSLLLAMAFPIGYGIYDILKFRKFNFISLLGLLNIAVTGGLALLSLEGIWFAIKEAAFPLLIGLAIFGSAFSKKPFIETLFLNPQLIKLDLVIEKLKSLGKETEFNQHSRNCTFLLALSFLFSALGNFIIAMKIFIPIDAALSPEARNLILNEQIAEMTAKGAAVLILPSMLFSGLVLWYLLSGLRKLTGLKTEEIFQH